MKKKKPYYLKMYKAWMLTGELPRRCNGAYEANGLCWTEGVDQAAIDLFEPTRYDHEQLCEEGLCTAWWASGLPAAQDFDELASLFTPLRQTIVLFLAAMNDEL